MSVFRLIKSIQNHAQRSHLQSSREGVVCRDGYRVIRILRHLQEYTLADELENARTPYCQSMYILIQNSEVQKIVQVLSQVRTALQKYPHVDEILRWMIAVHKQKYHDMIHGKSKTE